MVQIVKRVFIVGNAFKSSFTSMFYQRGWEVVDKPDKADFLQFTGGADINPLLYGEEPHSTTYFNKARDDFEVEMYHTWLGKKAMLGVCRGAQLFCALNGGKLYQDVDNHGRTHEVIDLPTGNHVVVSSIHHQMMRPARNGTVLAIANVATTKRFMNDGREVVHGAVGRGGDPDPEVVFYKDTQSLGIQAHPEFGPDSCTDYYFQLIERCF